MLFLYKGGGKDLATAAGINRTEEKPSINIKPIMKENNIMFKGDMMQQPKGNYYILNLAKVFEQQQSKDFATASGVNRTEEKSSVNIKLII